MVNKDPRRHPKRRIAAQRKGLPPKRQRKSFSLKRVPYEEGKLTEKKVPNPIGELAVVLKDDQIASSFCLPMFAANIFADYPGRDRLKGLKELYHERADSTVPTAWKRRCCPKTDVHTKCPTARFTPTWSRSQDCREGQCPKAFGDFILPNI